MHAKLVSLRGYFRGATMGAIVVLAFGRLMISPAAFADDSKTPLTVRVESLGDRTQEAGIKVAIADGVATIDVTRTPPMGRMRITTEGKWCEGIVLRLRVGGLENLQCDHGEVSVTASVLSHSDHKQLQFRMKGEKQVALDPKDPLWLEISRRDKDGKKLTSLPKVDEGGYFEIRIPAAMLAAEPQPLAIDWIDFYRR
ncbi:MAG: hypothetical protein RI963_2886 [Planctomycetota bacterium]